MDVVRGLVDGVLLLCGAGLLAAGFQAVTATEAVRHRLLHLPASRLLIERRARDARHALRDIFDRLASGDEPSVAAFSSAIAHASPAADWKTVADIARSTAQRALLHSGALLVDRLRYPEDVERIRSYLRAVVAHAGTVAACRPVEVFPQRQARAVPSSPKAEHFGDFMTAFSGAVILSDGSDTAARVLERVIVLDRSGTDADHSAVACEFADRLHPGDYDGAVLDVRSVGRIAHPTSPLFAALIEADVTCYAATEAGETPVGCKHLQPEVLGEGRSEFSFRRAEDGSLRRVASRTSLLTAYVLVRSADDQLVLAQRSKRTRNGRNVLSLTAGGVVEFADGAGDRDEYGSPSTAAAVRREALEEIGLDLSMNVIRPACVFQANSIGVSASGSVEGQVVVSVVYLAAVDLDAGELERRMGLRADPATGAFEVSHLASMPFGEEASACATWLRSNAERVDQHAAVGVSYALLLRFGQQATIEALKSAFEDRPWWMCTDGVWPVRTCFPVGRLGGRSTVEILADHEPRWLESWETLRREPA